MQALVNQEYLLRYVNQNKRDEYSVLSRIEYFIGVTEKQRYPNLKVYLFLMATERKDRTLFGGDGTYIMALVYDLIFEGYSSLGD